ncbi:MAG: DNA-processing protein DprA [Clostridia bacterium]|nr:DNA-processing protein DprA [Clostridia bacterium]
MSQELLYVLWYHRCFGKTQKGRKALSHYGGYKELYEAVYNGSEETGLLKNTSADKFRSFSIVDAEKVLWTCEDNGWQAISCTSPLYPARLLEISDYPHVIFADGDVSCLANPVAFAIVGSREATEKAEVIAGNAAYNLSKTGAVIVSGAAFGIDSAAHRGAINAGGKTIGVLGCGLGDSYMDRIGSFYDEIKNNGVYITELFPFESVTRGSFPDRNRIISGLSRAVLVACAAEGSGSLNTAAHAKKQQRRIYVPAPEICYSAGCEQLLEEGAYIFYNAGDIAYPFRECYSEGTFNDNYCNKPVSVARGALKYDDMALPKKNKKKRVAPVTKETKLPADNFLQETKIRDKKEEKQTDAPYPALNGTAKEVYELLADGALGTDDIVKMLGTDIVSVQLALFELEAEQLVRTIPGGLLQRI